jgi:DNA-binding MarR family transcriptional regulator
MNKTTSEQNQDVAYALSNNLVRLLLEFSKDFERRVLKSLQERGHDQIRPSHSILFSNLGLGAVRVTELANRAQVTQQAMGKMLKEVERIGYITRDIDSVDRRAKEIRLTAKGIKMVEDSMEVVAEVRQYYAQRVGEDELDQLEIQLREAVRKIGLEYLPESWVDQST